MIATITALVVARAIETESIDEFRLARQGKTLQIGSERLALTLIPVSAVVTKNVTMVSENTTLSDVLRTAGETSQSTLPVVDSDGELAGAIVVRDLLTRDRLRHRSSARSSTRSTSATRTARP